MTTEPVIPDQDVCVDVRGNAMPQPYTEYHVRATHLPTGLSVTAGPGRSQLELREQACAALAVEVAAAERDEEGRSA